MIGRPAAERTAPVHGGRTAGSHRAGGHPHRQPGRPVAPGRRGPGRRPTSSTARTPATRASCSPTPGSPGPPCARCTSTTRTSGSPRWWPRWPGAARWPWSATPGMPGVSDPGRRVVAAAAAAGLAVTVVPGPVGRAGRPGGQRSAHRPLLLRGVPAPLGPDRRERLAVVAAEPRTTVLFEAPGRVAATLADLAEACGADRRVAVARELTKLHEEVWRGTLAEAAPLGGARPVRGEVVLVLAGAPPEADRRDGRRRGPDQRPWPERLAAGERTRGVVDEVAAAVRGAPPPGLRAGPGRRQPAGARTAGRTRTRGPVTEADQRSSVRARRT